MNNVKQENLEIAADILKHNNDVDQEINTDDAVGYFFKENGYTFYVFNFTNDNVSRRDVNE